MKFTPATILLASLLLFTFGPACKKKDDPHNTTTPATQYDFTWSANPRAEYTVTFTSNVPEGHNVSWKIDTSISTGRIGYHVFKKGGVYTVSMAVDNDFANMVTKSITVDNPFVSFYYSGTPVVGDTIRFHTINGSSGKIFSWDFGDGATYSGIDPVHVYTTAGLYSVKLRVDNLYDASGNVKVPVVNDPLYTYKIAGNRNWQFFTRIDYVGSSVPDDTLSTTETVSITPLNKIAVSGLKTGMPGTGTLTYSPSLSSGNVLVFADEYCKLYFDHVADTLYFTGSARIGKYTPDGKGLWDYSKTGSSK